jgi:hypothetical protein
MASHCELLWKQQKKQGLSLKSAAAVWGKISHQQQGQESHLVDT